MFSMKRVPGLHELELLHMFSVPSSVSYIRKIEKQKHKIGDDEHPFFIIVMRNRGLLITEKQDTHPELLPQGHWKDGC